jgi:hypothetical protein
MRFPLGQTSFRGIFAKISFKYRMAIIDLIGIVIEVVGILLLALLLAVNK